jgi:hypothetical protein
MNRRIHLIVSVCGVTAAMLGQHLCAQEASPLDAAEKTNSSVSTISVFHVPKTNTPNGYTGPTGIDSQGTVIGHYIYYTDDIGTSGGFYRLADGTIKTLAPPGRDCHSAGVCFDETPTAINASGTMTGSYLSGPYPSFSGFLRSSEGVYNVFDAPTSFETLPMAINAAGEVTGGYQSLGSSGVGVVYGAFLRDTEGNFTTFTMPGAVSAMTGTSINSRGYIAGQYSSGAYIHGFFRDPDGKLTAIEPPGFGYYVTPVAIDDTGRIWGSFSDDITGYDHGFLRDPQGIYTVIDVPGADYTEITAANNNGTVTGYYASVTEAGGFYRTVDGTITTFVPPNAPADQTIPTAINQQGFITGHFPGNNDDWYGFVLTPR